MLKQLLEMPTGLPRTNGNHHRASEPKQEARETTGEDAEQEEADNKEEAQVAPLAGNSRLRETAVGFQLIVRELFDEANDLISKLDPFLVKGEPIKFAHEPAAGLKPHDTIHHEAEQVGNLLVTLRALKTRIDA